MKCLDSQEDKPLMYMRTQKEHQLVSDQNLPSNPLLPCSYNNQGTIIWFCTWPSCTFDKKQKPED